MFTYVQQKRHIIKYGTMSCFSQAINYASLCSTVWIVIFLHSCTQLWDKNKSWKVTAKLPPSCQRENCRVAGQGCKHIRVKETTALIERNEKESLINKMERGNQIKNWTNGLLKCHKMSFGYFCSRAGDIYPESLQVGDLLGFVHVCMLTTTINK